MKPRCPEWRNLSRVVILSVTSACSATGEDGGGERVDASGVTDPRDARAAAVDHVSPALSIDVGAGGAGGAPSNAMDAAPAALHDARSDAGSAGDTRAPADARTAVDASLASDAGDASVANDAGAAADARARIDANPSGDGAPSSARPGWNLVWSDEFDQATCPDPASWVFESGFVRNQELQWYQPENASCVDGMLVIEARRETKPNPNYLAGSTDWKRNRANITYTATSMTTAGKRSFTYGRFEIRARIDTRQGSWPAFWSLGQGGWPAGGEVDIMEFYNNNVLANVCRPMGSTCGWSSVRQPLSMLGGAAWSAAFHVWAMEWDAEKIDLFLDDRLVNHFVISTAVAAGQTNPYIGRPQYLLVNQAVGGTNGGDPSATAFPLRYEADYVRVYQRPAAP